MNKLSVIIPFCNEYPQVAFTVQAVLEELKQFTAPYEIVVVDNYCKEVSQQKVKDEFCSFCMHPFEILRTSDKGGEFLKEKAKKNPHIKYVEYRDKLSHWNAKNVGVKASTGNIFLFLDAHVVPSQGSIRDMFRYYVNNYTKLNGTLHLPLAYLLAGENQELIYSFLANPEKGFYHYTFSSYRKEKTPYEVACMSTCGMMISREIYNLLGGWPDSLHIYGGGENFLNFTLAVLDKKKWIMTTGPLYHYASDRGYYYNYDSFIKNRMIATYLFAGEEAAHKFARNCQGSLGILERLFREAVDENIEHRKLILSRQQMTISEWMIKIKERSFWNGLIDEREYVS